MASKRAVAASADFTIPAARIDTNPLEVEMSDSFLEYSYHVIGGRAIPDARDGLKPVHRRILFTMSEMGLTPSHAHVKVARISGQVLGLYHPHGDSAVNEALVRLAQDFSMSVPFVDGHGNFGSLDAGAAAARYIEARLAKAALGMVTSVSEDTVDLIPNYDGSLLEPSVLPAAFPNLLVNGAEGIAVGMATKMAPHNLEEAIAAARLLLAKPKATLDDLMAVIPGPDFPGGCEVVLGEGAREAFETGKGTVTMRAVARIEPLEGSRGRNQIIVSALPYMIGPEKVVEAIKKGIADKKITFVSDVINLSEGEEMALHIELKTGVDAKAALATLYATTPMQTNFAISNLALVGGQPRTMGLVEILRVWLDFRKEVVLRRSEFRRAKAEARLHLVEGLLIALDGIDLVVKTIRASKNTAEAKDALMKHRSLKLSELQATHVLEMPLRRLTSLEVDALREEKKTLEATITDLTDIIENPKRLVKVIDGELAEYGKANPSPRKSVLLDSVESVPVLVASAGAAGGVDAVADESERTWHLTAEGLLVETVDAKKDVVVGTAVVTGNLMLFCADGVAVKVPAALTDRMKASVAASHSAPVVGIAGINDTVIMATRNGTVKALKGGDFPQRGDEHSYIGLDKGDAVVSAHVVRDGTDAVFITSDAQLLRFPVASVRPQGRSGGGMAGVRLGEDTKVIGFFVASNDSVVCTWTDGGAGKSTSLAEYPAKGRGTGGVRCHGFKKGHTSLVRVFVGVGAVADEKGKPTKAPAAGKRDGSGA